MTGLRIAFKEWAVICRALAEGRQALILRKGGIAESGGAFRLEHSRFWLYPSWVHQQETGIRPEARGLLEQVQHERPPAGTVRLTHFAEVPCAYHLGDLDRALALADLHLWSEETVRTRFHYRVPGLFVLPVRLYRARMPIELPETPDYAGCRSWVTLDEDLATEEATPVLDEASFDRLVNHLDLILQPETQC